MMDLSPAEMALIEVIRAGAHGDMSVSVTRASGVYVVTVASPEENGLMLGAGPTLDVAVFSLIGDEPPDNPDDGKEATATTKPVLQLVAGADHCPVVEQGFASMGKPARMASRRCPTPAAGGGCFEPGEPVEPRSAARRSGPVSRIV